MVTAISKAITASWIEAEEKAGTSIGKDVATYLMSYEEVGPTVIDPVPDDDDHHAVVQVRQEEPHILALTRNRFPQQVPTGKLLEQTKAQMLRVHKAAGHPSMASLQRMLRARKAPQWAIDLAGSIECPACKEAKLPRPAPVASMHDTPGLFEIVGVDVFEYEFSDAKYKFLLMRDRASALVMVDFLKKYGTPEESAWEPTSDDIIRSFGRWLMVNPAPKWIVTDSARYFTSQKILDYAGQSGIGVLTAPAEAHHMMGAEEGAINILKQTVSRLLKDDESMDIDLAFHLSAHGHNQSVGPSGFSPFQWTRGSSAPIDNIPLGVNPKKAFGGMLRLKEKARVAFEAESAKSRLSKLNNTVPRPTAVYKPGQLVMLWRHWVGPIRLILQEGQTLWLATGSTLIRARIPQVRPCARNEELTAILEGTAILKLPVTLDSLLRSFTGRYYSDVTGQVPSPEALQQDLQPAEVRIQPDQQVRPDSWKITNADGARWLVRIHSMPRISLFIPGKTQTTPVDEEMLTGVRKTKVNSLLPPSEIVEIHDDYKEGDEPTRSLQDRWTGETWFEMKSSAQDPVMKKARKTPRSGVKRKPEEEAEDLRSASHYAEAQKKNHQINQRVMQLRSQNVPNISPLTTALRDRGADAVDGVPAVKGSSSSSVMRCSTSSCVLQGGHVGPHEDVDGVRFVQSSDGNGVIKVDDETPDDSSSSDSSEELVPAETINLNEVVKSEDEVKMSKAVIETPEVFYALEIPILHSDTIYLTKNPEKSSIWLSRKMMEKEKGTSLVSDGHVTEAEFWFGTGKGAFKCSGV